MQIVSAYLLAASAVDSGNYDEDYDIDIDPSFEEYMDIAGDEIVGDYIELQAPTDGGAGNFDGSKFCAEWLSAFARPIEYFDIYKNKAGYPAPSITQNSPLWATYPYSNTQSIPQYLDSVVYTNYGKHINFWTATISPPDPNIMQDRVAVKMWGAYIGNNVSWKVASNQPQHGFISYYYDYYGSDIYLASATDEYFNGYDSNGWINNWQGSHNPLETTFVLVYNVNAFKNYLNSLDAYDIGRFLADHHFVLAECNISKNKA